MIFAAGGGVTAIASTLHPTGGTARYHSSIVVQLAAPIGAPSAG